MLEIVRVIEDGASWRSRQRGRLLREIAEVEAELSRRCVRRNERWVRCKSRGQRAMQVLVQWVAKCVYSADDWVRCM